MCTKVKKKNKIGYNLATFSVNLPRKRTKKEQKMLFNAFVTSRKMMYRNGKSGIL
jgi:hypothetical protein